MDLALLYFSIYSMKVYEMSTRRCCNKMDFLSLNSFASVMDIMGSWVAKEDYSFTVFVVMGSWNVHRTVPEGRTDFLPLVFLSIVYQLLKVLLFISLLQVTSMQVHLHACNLTTP